MALHTLFACRRRRTMGTALAGLLVALLVQHLWFFHSWEARTWDWRVRLMAEPGAATDQVRMVLLDQDSLAWAESVYGVSWPWPREFYAAILDYLTAQGAAAVAFDVLFTEDQARDRPEDDARLVQAAADSGRLVTALFLGRGDGDALTWPDGIKRPQLAIQGLENLPESLQARIEYPRAAFPFPELANRVAMLGTVQAQEDEDGVVRRVPLISLFGGHVSPSLGLAPLLVEAQHRLMTLRFADEDDVLQGLLEGGGMFEVDGQRIPVDASTQALLRFRGPSGTHRAYSAAQVLQRMDPSTAPEGAPVIDDPEAFKDRFVFFGFSAPGLMDLRTTPVGGAYPGVEVWATLLDNLLSGDAMRMAHPVLAHVVLFLCCMAAAGVANCMESAWRQAGTMCLVIPLPVAASFAAYGQGVWLPMVAPLAGVIATFTMATLVNYAMEGQNKRFLKNAFQQYLHPDVVEELIQHPEKLALGGERKELSIFFSDLEGFTTLSEKLDAETVTRFLNDYLTAMTDIILSEGGTVDKYEGDAIIAFWNAPKAWPDHPARAMRAAMRCQEKLAQLRPYYTSRLGMAPRMRIGINTGAAIVGNLGSSTRFDYSMISDAVNLAARLESLNKQFGTYTMCSSAAREAFAACCGEGEIVFRELGRVQVKGKEQPVFVYEMLSRQEADAKAMTLSTFQLGLEAFYDGKLEEACELFLEVAANDAPAKAYAKKCGQSEKTEREAWSGVWVMTSK